MAERVPQRCECDHRRVEVAIHYIIRFGCVCLHRGVSRQLCAVDLVFPASTRTKEHDVGALRMVRGLSLCQLSHEFMCMGLGQWLDGLCVQIRGQYLCVSSCLQLDPNVVSNARAAFC